MQFASMICDSRKENVLCSHAEFVGCGRPARRRYCVNRFGFRPEDRAEMRCGKGARIDSHPPTLLWLSHRFLEDAKETSRKPRSDGTFQRLPGFFQRERIFLSRNVDTQSGVLAAWPRML